MFIPNEILIMIGENLGSRDLYTLIRANRRFAVLLTPLFRATAIKEGNSYLLMYWAVLHADRDLAQQVLEKGNVTVVKANVGSGCMHVNEIHGVFYQAPGRCDDTKLEWIMSQGTNLLLWEENDNFPVSVLLWAIKSEHHLMLKLALEKAPQPPPDLRTPVLEKCFLEMLCPRYALSQAAIHGNEVAVQMLLDYGFKPDGYCSSVPLVIAAAHGYANIVRTLIKNGANPHAVGYAHHIGVGTGTALDMAEAIVYPEVGVTLVEDIVDPDASSAPRFDGVPALYMAVQQENEALTKYLLDHGASSDIGFIDSSGQTVLHKAIIKNNFAISKLLIDNGADVNAAVKSKHGGYSIVGGWLKDQKIRGDQVYIDAVPVKPYEIFSPPPSESGDEEDIDTVPPRKYGTPLQMAACYGDKETIKLLLENGADVNVRSLRSFRSVLYYAVLAKSPGAVKVLSEGGADINAQDCIGRSPLHRAVHGMFYQAEVVTALLERGADINARDSKGFSPLHISMRRKGTHSETAAALLLEKGADANAQDSRGRSPFYLAFWSGISNIDLMALFLEKGADINMQDHDGFSPLHVAVRRPCSTRLVVFLLENRADINLQDSEGESPLHVAFKRCRTEVIEILRDWGANFELQDNEGLKPGK